MSIINIISNDELTLVQGVNGLFFCEESWVTQSRAVSRIGKVLPKEIIGTKDQSTNIVHPQTDRTKLSCQKHETSYYNPQIEMFARFKMKSSFHKTKRII